MSLFQRKIFACFMGFAVLSIFNVNHAFAETKTVKVIMINKILQK